MSKLNRDTSGWALVLVCVLIAAVATGSPIPEHDTPIPFTSLPAPAKHLRRTGCTCINANYPCYAYYANWDAPTCFGGWSQDYCETLFQDSAGTIPAEYCVRAACTISNCDTCSTDGQSCKTCATGFMADGASCSTEEDFFSDVTMSILDGGVVAMVSPKLHGLLYPNPGSYNTRLVAQAFTRFFSDNFELVYVYPSDDADVADGTSQFYTGADGVGGTSRLQGAINGGGYSGTMVASMHELMHNYAVPSNVLPDKEYSSGTSFYAHWGVMSHGGDVRPMLGGQTREGFKCADPADTIPTVAEPCNTDTVKVDSDAGAFQTSNDGGSYGVSNLELYLMGLLTEDQFLATNTEIAYCPLQTGSWSSSNLVDDIWTFDCRLTAADGSAAGLQMLSAQQIVDKNPRNGHELSPNYEIRSAVVMLFPDTSSLPATLNDFSYHQKWVSAYFATTMPPVFAAAVRDLATIDYMVSTEDQKDSIPGTSLSSQQPSSKPSSEPSSQPSSSSSGSSILFAGDSDIREWNKRKSKSWSTNKAFQNSKNVGRDGWTCKKLLKKIDTFVEQNQPDWVVVVCGENDMAYGKSPWAAYAQFRKVVNKITAAGARVLYMGTKLYRPWVPDSKSLWKKYRKYDKKVSRLAAQLSSTVSNNMPPLVMIDVYKGFKDVGNKKNLYQSDKLHLSFKGYKLWNEWAHRAIATQGEDCYLWRSGSCSKSISDGRRGAAGEDKWVQGQE